MRASALECLQSSCGPSGQEREVEKVEEKGVEGNAMKGDDRKLKDEGEGGGRGSKKEDERDDDNRG